ncbi:RnaseH [Xanthomonas phage Xoo-sp13]|nr:RnaseH [Xanthomonas phage Xoo-sp13]
MARKLIIDVSNILYRTFFPHIKESLDVNVGMCHHIALSTINKYYNKYKPDDLILAFDDYSWRKAYTKDIDTCVTYKPYKGTRRKGMSASDRAKMEKFDSHISEFVELFREKTRVLVLKAKYLEADDLIAGYIQANPEDEHYLISADKDFMQLLVRNNLHLVDPTSDKERTLTEYNDDPDYFMYVKCIRGDDGDNVMSSYPRLRETKIAASYRDALLRTNIMQHEFKVLINDDDGVPIEKKFVTQEVFDENILLMDLTAQPDFIRTLIDKTINEALESRGKFNYMEFLRFCGKYELNNIRSNIDAFVPMLSCKRKGA